MTGFVDELAIFNKELSSTEVEEIFNRGKALDIRDHSCYYGDDLIQRTNGVLDASDWILDPGDPATIVDGVILFNSNGPNDTYAYQSILTQGKRYRVVFSGTITSGSLYIGQNGDNTYSFPVGTYNNESFVFEAALSDTKFIIRRDGVPAGSTVVASITSVSVEEVQTLGYWRNNGAEVWSDLSAYGCDGTYIRSIIEGGDFTLDDEAYPNNGPFTAGSNSTLTIESNQLKVTNAGGDSFGNAHQSFTVINGGIYEVTGALISKTGNASIKIDRTSTGANNVSFTDNTNVLTTTASATPVTKTFISDTNGTFYIALTNDDDGGNVVFDNIDVKLKSLNEISTLKLQEVPLFKKDTFGFPMNMVRERGLNFDGSSFAQISDDTSLDVATTNEISVEVWYKAHSVASYDEAQYLFMSEIWSDPDGWGLGANTSNFFFSAQDASVGGGENEDAVTPHNDSVNWVHIVATNDETNHKIYINGALKDTGPADTAMVDKYPIYIGSRKGINFFTNGIIDDIKIYNKALTLAEVKKNYNKTLSAHPVATASWSDDFDSSFV
jgi:hypothetical protein